MPWPSSSGLVELGREAAAIAAIERLATGSSTLAAACHAYSEAIACGDGHEDAFARDRRLQFEMQLLARGEPVPTVPDAALADSAAFAIVRATAARLPSPRVFMVRPTALDDVSVISREGDGAYTFASLRGSACFALAELDEGHAAMLAELDRYLEPL